MSAVHREHKLSASIRSILSPKTGPSGAEKTMLLHVLSSRPTSNVKFTVQVQVRLNQTLVDPTDIYIRHKIVSLKTTPSPTPAHNTPLECLLFSAKSRMPCNTSLDAKHEALTERMIRVLGLEACAHVRFGGGGLLLPGNAGGECRRTSAGVELVTKPEKSFLMNPHPDRFLFGTATLSSSERIEGGIDRDQCHFYHPSTIALLLWSIQTTNGGNGLRSCHLLSCFDTVPWQRSAGKH